MKRFITRAIGATKLFAHANGPTIMVTAGVVSMGVGTVLACRQTLYVESILRPHTEDLDKIQRGTDLGLDSYKDEHAKADRIKVYTRVALDLGKLYAVPATLFISGAGLVFGGHRIMIRRNATLALAFTSLSRSFEAYRERVRNTYGAEVEQQINSGRTLREVVNDQGELEYIAEPGCDTTVDPYNRIFGENLSSQWQNDLGINTLFVANAQRMANILLNTRGHLYLSEVYESLGFPESDISRVVGWKVTRLPDGTRDIPHVDFGINTPHPMDDVCKRENAIYLDFNCQGLIVGGRVQKALEKA